METGLAKFEDYGKICRLLAEHYYPEHSYGKSTPLLNFRKAATTVAATMENNLVFVSKSEGEVVGSIGLRVDQYWWSDENCMADTWFYILPKYRASSIAVRLLGMAERKANELGVRLVIGVFNGLDTERKENFLTRRGYLRMGGLFLKECA